MKTKIVAGAIFLASTSLSFAADMATKAPILAPVPVWSWTGFYLGGHVGAGWGTTESTLTGLTGAGGGIIPGGFPIDQNSRSGFLGGGQAGYNWQTGWAVLGVQGDIAGMDVKGTTPCVFIASCTGKSDWLATVTGRLGGVVADRTLVYVKGGAAWLHTDHTFSAAAGLGPAAFSVSSNSTSFGWLIGLGAEYAFDHNWSAFIEYDYMDFDKKSIAFDFSPLAGVPAVANVDIKNKLSIAKVGLNYKFGGPAVARY
ncbi:porin family protein [Bradyrhizobium sp. 139]|uniref:outer membrane protein n=1 Tax=Bradyrhizobium sp. 139 TaxID=2782616 RepID=UPI001FF99371|nr:outer membrane protein [Bradyrhizobium sp. 139]MCK1742373.1 porin family protein [Bradyrhizobium sp. 139]